MGFIKSPKVLIIQMPPWGVSAVPLGVAYLSEYLASRNISVSVFDFNIEFYNRVSADYQDKWMTNSFEFWASGGVLESGIFDKNFFINRVCSFKPDIIGFSCTVASVPVFNYVVDELRGKLPGSVFVVGGAVSSNKVHRSLFKEGSVDYFIIGEGEYALAELAESFSKRNIDRSVVSVSKDKLGCKSVCLQSNREVDVDRIPFPSFERFAVDWYTEKDLMPLLLSRGCINTCNFCCDWQLKHPFRFRSPEMIVDEIKFLVTRFGRKRFEFCDLLINGDLAKLEKLCDLLIEENLNIAWGGQVAVRAGMDAAFFVKLRKAGCGGLTFGFESFSKNVLRLMNKPFDPDDAAKVIKKAKDAGIIVEGNLIVGFPGETEADVDETLDFVRAHLDFIDRINSLNVCCLDPGMKIWERAEEFGIDLNSFDDLYEWHTNDYSNTIEIRMRRYEKMTRVFEDCNLVPKWRNVKE